MFWNWLKKLFQEDTDHNAVVFIGSTGEEIILDLRLPSQEKASDFDDTLKLSNCHQFNVIAKGIVYGGTEDCLDINRGEDLVVTVSLWADRKTCRFITIKGGATNIVVRGECIGNPKVAVELGMWSDQSQEKVRDVDLTNLILPAGSIIHIWNSELPKLAPGANVVVKQHPILTYLYFTFKRLIRKVTNRS